jgi:hypothetical protein
MYLIHNAYFWPDGKLEFTLSVIRDHRNGEADFGDVATWNLTNPRVFMHCGTDSTALRCPALDRSNEESEDIQNLSIKITTNIY